MAWTSVRTPFLEVNWRPSGNEFMFDCSFYRLRSLSLPPSEALDASANNFKSNIITGQFFIKTSHPSIKNTSSIFPAVSTSYALSHASEPIKFACFIPHAAPLHYYLMSSRLQRKMGEALRLHNLIEHCPGAQVRRKNYFGLVDFSHFSSYNFFHQKFHPFMNPSE